MNCNSGIRGDDSDVDIETIIDTARSVEIPGHSIQNISSASAPISSKPLVMFLNLIIEKRVPAPITRSYRIKKMPSRKSGKISISQASSLKSQTENSAARCCVIQGQEPKVLSDNKLTKGQSNPKYTQVHNRLRCHISASTSTTTTVKSTKLARRTYIRNPAVRAIDKEGSYQHYLHRKVKQLISIMHTYVLNVDRELRLFDFALDSYIPDFDRELTLMKSKAGSNDCASQFKLLTSTVKSFTGDLQRRRIVINSILKSYAKDLEKKITLLNSKITSYAHDLELQITLMNSKINSFVADLKKKLDILHSKANLFIHYVKREYEPLIRVFYCPHL